MTKEKVLQRKETLEQQRLQLIANTNAVLGAIQDCEFWLSQFEETEKPDVS
jgi:phosphoribosyl-dephospho-CoA transferase